MIKLQDNFTDNATFLRKEKRRRQGTDFTNDENLENEIWLFLQRIGFTKLNIGRECEVQFGRDEKNILTKKVDIIADSEDVRIYIECTTQKSITPKIKEWKSEVQSIRKYENGNADTEKKNVAFAIFTDQELSLTDTKILQDAGITYLSPKIIEYFNELIRLYKNLAYYQFLAFAIGKQIIRSFEKEDFEIPAIRCKYSNKEYCYLFGIQPSKLIPLSTILHRKMDFEEGISENYQRLVKKQKISEIKKFITEKRGVFPTNIIISFETKGDDFFKQSGKKQNEIQFGMLSLPRQFQSVTVIDGQHRLFAYDGLPEAERDLIYVIGFHKLDIESQIKTFININEKQTKVSASLMWDLYPSLLENQSEIKSRISRIVKKLNTQSDSALFGTIQYDSAPYSNKGSKITLESICTAIESEKIITDIDAYVNLNEIKVDSDKVIYEVIKDYFNTIQELNPEHWNRNEKTKNLLRSNQGIGAFIKLLKESLKYLNKKDVFALNFKDWKHKEWFNDLLSPVNDLIKTLNSNEEIKKFKRIGEGGKQQIYQDFAIQINKSFSDFYVKEQVKNSVTELESIRIELLNNGEHDTLEAKESFFTNTKLLHHNGTLEKNKDEAIRGIIKTIVAFSNYLGGRIAIGLNDPAFDFIGLDDTDLKFYKDWDKFKQALNQKIDSETTGLIIRPKIDRIIHDSKTFAIIRVKPLPKERFEQNDLASMKFDSHCYKRENGDTTIIKPNEIKKYCDLVLKELVEETEHIDEE